MVNILLKSTILSFTSLFDKDMRSLFWRVLFTSIFIILLAWFILKHCFAMFLIQQFGAIPPLLSGWGLILLISFTFGVGHLFYLLLSAAMCFIGSYFADDVIAIIEKKDFPQHIAGRAMTNYEALIFSLRFFLIAVVGNLIALLFYFVFPIHLIAFYVINAYILGRSYFILNAMRFYDYHEATRIFKENVSIIFIGGLIISFICSLPLLNLISPIFAASFMTYLFKNLNYTRLEF